MASSVQIETLIQEYQVLQETLKANQLSKQQLLGQANENESVFKELNILESDAVLYKLVGPVLVKQSSDEAKQVVQKRLEYIKREMTRIDQVGEEVAEKIDTRAKELSAYQQQFMRDLQRQQS